MCATIVIRNPCLSFNTDLCCDCVSAEPHGGLNWAPLMTPPKCGLVKCNSTTVLAKMCPRVEQDHQRVRVKLSEGKSCTCVKRIVREHKEED